MGASWMSRKHKEVQTQVASDGQWKDILQESSIILIEVYSQLWGKCECFKPLMQRMYFAYMDKIKFCVVAAEDVSAFEDFQELALPHFLFFKLVLIQDGKR